MVNVLIVEDSRISRESFERQLAASPDFIVLAAIENAANAEIACMRNKIDLVLMDVWISHIIRVRKMQQGEKQSFRTNDKLFPVENKN